MTVDDLDTLLKASRILANIGMTTLSQDVERAVRAEAIQTHNPR